MMTLETKLTYLMSVLFFGFVYAMLEIAAQIVPPL
jgi:hypothetical protein